MRFHSIADLFPLLGDAELRALASDLKGGQLEPIIALKGTDLIVDGRNRWKACGMINKAPWIEYVEFADDAAIARFVMSKNIHRRHLTTDQRAAIGAELATMRQGGDRTKSIISNDSLIMSDTQAAETGALIPAALL